MAGWATIVRLDGSDGDLVTGVDVWGNTNINRTRNNFKSLGSIRHQQVMAIDEGTDILAAVETRVPNQFPAQVDWSQIAATMTVRVRCYLFTASGAGSATPKIRRITGTPAFVATGSAYTGDGINWSAVQTITIPNESSVQDYELWLLPSSGAVAVRGKAVLEIF